MKTQRRLVILASLFAILHQAVAQNAAFTYQGLLTDNGAAVNGSVELQFTLWGTESGGALPLASNTPPVLALMVTNGQFTALLDFGAAGFDGGERWMQIELRTTLGPFVAVTPRQRITATPYAVRAANFGGVLTSNQLAGNYPNAMTLGNTANVFSGTFNGSGGGLSNVNANTLGGLSASTFWRIDGNTGTSGTTHFLGTTDNQPLELRVDGARALRLEPNTNGAPNIIAGAAVNNIEPGVSGATIGGGGGSNVFGAGRPNTVAGDFATISGGVGNRILSPDLASTIGGGWVNTIRDGTEVATIGGGEENLIQAADAAVIGGGSGNAILPGAARAVVGGGSANTIESNAQNAVIAGGYGNTVQSNAVSATISGGTNNTVAVLARYATIGGGIDNTIESDAYRSTIGGGYRNTIGSPGYSGPNILGNVNTIAGGARNAIAFRAHYNAISGGIDHSINEDAYWGTIAGGYLNVIGTNTAYGVVSGGRENFIANSARFATIPGGHQNSATNYAFAAGRRAKANHAGAFVWADSQDADFPSTVTNQFSVRANGGVRFLTGGVGMTLDGQPVLSGLVTSGQLTDGATLAELLDDDGAASGLDADLLDGLNSTAFALAAHTHSGADIVSGTVADARIAATIARDSEILPTVLAGDGPGSGLNADFLDGLSSAAFWQLGGNAGTTPGTHFLGTTDNQPLEFKVNSLRALRLEDNGDSIDSGSLSDGAPNVIGGAPINFVAAGVVGATIAGGGATNYASSAYTNSIFENFGVISGGLGNRLAPGAFASAIAGGRFNHIGANSDNSAISGGHDNLIATGSRSATIVGGWLNEITNSSSYCTIVGGQGNTIERFSSYSSIAGGSGNELAGSDYSAVGGGRNNRIANSRFSVIGGGENNDLGTNSLYNVIGGGDENSIGAYSTNAIIAGGNQNSTGTNVNNSVIGGGDRNYIADKASYSTIAGGLGNRVGTNGDSSTISGGGGNIVGDNVVYAAIAGGLQNEVRSGYSSIMGGRLNVASGGFATVAGGEDNSASGDYSFAAGRGARATFQGAFVWADSQSGTFSSQLPDQVNFRCQGGVRFTTGNAGANQTVNWLPGLASWSFSSDRNLKEAVKPVDTREVLDKVTRLPMNEWNFKGYAQRHIGPMAQDFHEQFPLNDNDKMIDSGDLHGVALAAIQGLNEVVKEKDARIAGLEKRLSDLETLVRSLGEKK